MMQFPPNAFPSVCGKLSSGNKLDALTGAQAGDSVSVNGARGTRDIEGKTTRVGASEVGGERVSKVRWLKNLREYRLGFLARARAGGMISISCARSGRPPPWRRLLAHESVTRA